MEKKNKKTKGISATSIAFYCKQQGVSSKKYFLSVDSPSPFSFTLEWYPAEAGIGQLVKKITLNYDLPNMPAGVSSIQLSNGEYNLPPNPGDGKPGVCIPVPGSFVNKDLYIDEIQGGMTTSKLKKPYDKARHNG